VISEEFTEFAERNFSKNVKFLRDKGFVDQVSFTEGKDCEVFTNQPGIFVEHPNN